MAAWIQALGLLLFVTSAVRAAPASQLGAECEGVVKGAIAKPYGWGIGAAVQSSSQPMPKGAALVDLRETARAAILLQMAGRELHDEGLRKAASRLAWGLAAAQQSSGRIPSVALFAASASSRDTAEQQAERASTQNGLLAMLLVLETSPEDHRVHSAAMRAAHWLCKQQTHTGGFPTLYARWSDAAPMRLLRLDRTEFRDAALALTAAAYVDGTLDLRFAANRAVEALLKLRSDSLTATGLWQSVYDLGGAPSDVLEDRANCIDTLASRYAMQVLLASGLLLKNADAEAGLDRAVKTLPKVRYEDGLFLRLYPLKNNEIPAMAPGPAPRPPNLFRPRFKVEEDLYSPGTFGLLEVMDTVNALKSGKTSLERLSKPFTPMEQIALVVSGMRDELLTADFPHTAAQAREWMAADRKRAFSGGEAETDVGRIYETLLRMRIGRLALE